MQHKHGHLLGPPLLHLVWRQHTSFPLLIRDADLLILDAILLVHVGALIRDVDLLILDAILLVHLGALIRDVDLLILDAILLVHVGALTLEEKLVMHIYKITQHGRHDLRWVDHWRDLHMIVASTSNTTSHARIRGGLALHEILNYIRFGKETHTVFRLFQERRNLCKFIRMTSEG